MTWYRHEDGSPFEGSDLDPQCSECKPIVVIDPEDEADVQRFVDALYVKGNRQFGVYLDWLEVQATLREFANPKPPKPDEPTGLGAVVEDADGNPWVKTLSGIDEDAYEWIAGFPSDPRLVSYKDIDAVKVLSEGVAE